MDKKDLFIAALFLGIGGVLLYVLINRRQQEQIAANQQYANTVLGNTQAKTSLPGNLLRGADNVATKACTGVAAYFGVSAGSLTSTLCNYSRKLDPVHYVVGEVSGLLDKL